MRSHSLFNVITDLFWICKSRRRTFFQTDVLKKKIENAISSNITYMFEKIKLLRSKTKLFSLNPFVVIINVFKNQNEGDHYLFWLRTLRWICQFVSFLAAPLPYENNERKHAYSLCDNRISLAIDFHIIYKCNHENVWSFWGLSFLTYT